MEETRQSYLNRKLIKFVCDNCGKESEKPESEYKRNLKLSRKNFCCRSCAASYNNRHKQYKELSVAQKQHLTEISSNRRDEYTPFRYTLRCIKRRCKEVNVTLDDLKEIWDIQNGICPYTNIKLTLPQDSNINVLDITERASLDRIDSSKGYIKENIQFISTPINYMKNVMSDLQTKSFLKRISTYTSTFIED